MGCIKLQWTYKTACMSDISCMTANFLKISLCSQMLPQLPTQYRSPFEYKGRLLTCRSAAPQGLLALASSMSRAFLAGGSALQAGSGNSPLFCPLSLYCCSLSLRREGGQKYVNSWQKSQNVSDLKLYICSMHVCMQNISGHPKSIRAQNASKI